MRSDPASVMASVAQPLLRKPRTADEVLRCLIWEGWHPSCSFVEGSRHCETIKAPLIRQAIRKLRAKRGLYRYHQALGLAIRLSGTDATVESDWRTALKLLRILEHASPIGTPRQRLLLLEVARNGRVVQAMRRALKTERRIRRRSIEPTWIAVLYAEGSAASVAVADRFNAHLSLERQNQMRGYLPEAR